MRRQIKILYFCIQNNKFVEMRRIPCEMKSTTKTQGTRSHNDLPKSFNHDFILLTFKLLMIALCDKPRKAYRKLSAKKIPEELYHTNLKIVRFGVKMWTVFSVGNKRRHLKWPEDRHCVDGSTPEFSYDRVSISEDAEICTACQFKINLEHTQIKSWILAVDYVFRK